MEGEKPSAEDQMKKKWESLHQKFSTKQKLLQSALEQEQEQPVTIHNFSAHSLYKKQVGKGTKISQKGCQPPSHLSYLDSASFGLPTSYPQL